MTVLGFTKTRASCQPDHALCSELGCRGFEHVRRFGMRLHVESVERLYRDVMALGSKERR